MIYHGRYSLTTWDKIRLFFVPKKRYWTIVNKGSKRIIIATSKFYKGDEYNYDMEWVEPENIIQQEVLCEMMEVGRR